MEEEQKRLQSAVNSHSRIVFFGGAGVSTASGIPDFRSKDGLYNQTFDYPPEEMLSHKFFQTHQVEFFQFYRQKILTPGVQPNAAHIKLAQWEDMGKLSAVVTQNIDHLHQAAGSRRVLELHGSAYRNICVQCGASYPGLDVILKSQGVPRCPCGGVIRPDVVLYGEPLDEAVVEEAVEVISRADMLIVGGTSLVVYPAAGLLRYFKGDVLAVVNLGSTDQDQRADIVIDGDISQIFAALKIEYT